MQQDVNRVRQFAELWKKEFGEILTPEEAQHSASQLMELYYLLARTPTDSKISPDDTAPDT